MQICADKSALICDPDSYRDSGKHYIFQALFLLFLLFLFQTLNGYRGLQNQGRKGFFQKETASQHVAPRSICFYNVAGKDH
jgi:hypothetical protein